MEELPRAAYTSASVGGLFVAKVMAGICKYVFPIWPSRVMGRSPVTSQVTFGI